jgi:hypothetical protein
MVREPDATMQPTPQDNQLMSKHRVLSLKPQLRLEWRGQDRKSETEQPDHSASLRRFHHVINSDKVFGTDRGFAGVRGLCDVHSSSRRPLRVLADARH